MRSPLRYWPPAGHLALIAACVMVAYWRMDTLDVAPAQVVAASPVDIAAAAPTASVSSDSGLVTGRPQDAETVASRPLFKPGRRPEADPAPEPQPETTEETVPDVDMRMVGYVRRDNRSFAIIETTANGRTHVVQVGDEIEGMTVREVSRASVLMDLGGRTKDVRLFNVSLP